MKRYKECLMALIAVVILYLVFYLLGIGCPIKFLTGISCAGCGMTRAYLSLIRGDVSGAFSYHPLFILPPLAVLIIVMKAKLPAKIYYLLLFTITAVFLIIYILRLLDGSDHVVVFEPENGLIYRMGKFVFDVFMG